MLERFVRSKDLAFNLRFLQTTLLFLLKRLFSAHGRCAARTFALLFNTPPLFRDSDRSCLLVLLLPPSRVVLSPHSGPSFQTSLFWRAFPLSHGMEISFSICKALCMALADRTSLR